MATIEELKKKYRPPTVAPTVRMPADREPGSKPSIPELFQRYKPLTPEQEQVVAERKRQKELEARYVSEGQRFKAGLVRPAAELYAGVRDLLGREPSPEELERLEYLRAARGPAATAGELVTELGLLAVPGGVVARGAKAITRAPGLKRALTTLGGESALVGGYEAAKLPTEDLTRGERAALGTAFTAGTGGLLMGTGRLGRSVALPSRFRKSRAAYRAQRQRREAGVDEFIPMFRAMEGQGPASRLTRWAQTNLMASMPWLGDPFIAGVRASDDAFRDMMLKQSVPEGVEIASVASRRGTTAPVQAAVKDIQDFYKGEYKRILEPFDYPVRGQRFQRILARAPKKARKNIESMMERAFEDSGVQGLVPGGTIKNLQTEFRNLARKAKLDAEKQTYWAYDEALEEIIQRRLGWQDPQLLADYARLARPYRNFLTVQDAARNKAKEAGEFSQMDIIQAAKVKRGQPRSVVAGGQGPLQRAATMEAGDLATQPQRPNAFVGLAGTGTVGGLMGAPAAAGMMAGPAAAAGSLIPAAAGAQIAGSAYRPVQQYLMREQPWQKRVADELRRRRGTYGRIRRGTTYAAGTQGPEEFE